MSAIALDWDNTANADLDFWTKVVALGAEHGHRILVVTARRPTDENRELVKVPGAPTYFTSLSPKKWYMESIGIKIDIWIDDDPRVILEGM